MSTTVILDESVNNLKFESIIENVSNNYISYCSNIQTILKNSNLDREKHLKLYTKNFTEFKTMNTKNIFNFFLKNCFLNMNEFVENNVDFFLTQKPYIKLKSTKKRKLNQNANFIVPGVMFRYVISTMREAPKDGKVSKNKDTQLLFSELNAIFHLFSNNEENYLENLHIYITENFNNKKLIQRFQLIIDNYKSILENEKEEEVSSEEEEKPEHTENEKSTDMPNMPFDASFIENSSIGQLAKEISSELSSSDLENLKNPADLLGNLGGLFGAVNGATSGNNQNESGLNNLISKIAGKLNTKMEDGSLQKDSLANDVQKVMGSLGGLMGEGGNGFDISSIMKNMFK